MGKINDLKDQALATLNGKWGSFVGLTFIFVLLYSTTQMVAQFGTIFSGSRFTTLAIIFVILGLVLAILMMPLQYGYYIAHLRASRQDLPAEIGDLFIGYKRFADVFLTMLLQGLIIFGSFIPAVIFMVATTGTAFMSDHPVFQGLLTFLLMVPGYILYLAYAMVPFILHDKPELHPVGVLQESFAMMQGHKKELFLLMLSFLGWALLGLLTFFIGYLWLAPYFQMTEVKFYEQLRAEYESVAEEGGEQPVVEESAPDTAEPESAEVTE
jgi:uncharacterized membrane protein